jgi:spore coat protein U-like protein
MRGTPVLGAALVALLLAAPSAHAAGSNTCQILNVTPLAFGGYRSGTAFPVDSAGELDVKCGSMVTLQIEMGHGLSGRLSPRRMTFLNSWVGYNLYIDAARTVVWGDGTGGSQAYMATVTMGQTLHVPVYGRMYALQEVPSGIYTDEIEVVILF